MCKRKLSKWLFVIVLLLAVLYPLSTVAESELSVMTEGAPDMPAAVPQETQAEETLSNLPPAGYFDIDYVPPQYERPEAYGLRRSAVTDSRYVTPDLPPVRNQGDTGTCWAFASLGAAEISMIKAGYADASDINLSELQLAWFHHKGTLNADGVYNDPLNLFGGDHNEYKPEMMYGGIWGGDNYLLSNKTLASWIGGTQEDAATAFTPDNIASIPTSGLAYEYAFSKDSAHLQNVRAIPANDMNGMKQAIFDYGALAINYASYTHYYSPGDREYFFSKGFFTNHAVLIVGWDDNISKDLFPADEGNQPSQDGAWIVRNSYGDYHGPDGEKDGYFYMSYETEVVSSPYNAVFALAFEPANNYQHCYQYDGSASRKALSYPIPKGTTTTIREANVFTAQRKERLRAVSFWLDNHAKVDYAINVYRGSDITAGNPAPGTPATTLTGQTDYAGYYTISLAEPLTLDAGETFTVEVQFLNVAGSAVASVPDKKFFYVPFDVTSSDGWIDYTSCSSAGQSYLYNNDQWIDLSAGTSITPGNLRIKAFTDGLVASITVSAPQDYLYMRTGDTLQMSTAVTPSDARSTAVTWSISAGNEHAEITDSGLLSPKSLGQVTVRATAQDGSGTYGEKTIMVSSLPNITFALPTDSFDPYHGASFWVDGVQTPGTVDNGQITIALDRQNASVLTAYKISGGIPRGMYVWLLTYNPASGYVATIQPELEDLLTYHGFSIRVKAPAGIRFRSGISTALKQALTSAAGQNGFRLKEYGTLVILASNLNTLPFIKGGQKTSYGEAYWTDASNVLHDIVYETQNGRQIFTSVLKNIADANLKSEFAFRGCIELTKEGKSYLIYGPPVTRSIYTVAGQVMAAHEFAEGTVQYNFVKRIIDVGNSQA